MYLQRRSRSSRSKSPEIHTCRMPPRTEKGSFVRTKWSAMSRQRGASCSSYWTWTRSSHRYLVTAHHDRTDRAVRGTTRVRLMREVPHGGNDVRVVESSTEGEMPIRLIRNWTSLLDQPSCWPKVWSASGGSYTWAAWPEKSRSRYSLPSEQLGTKQEESGQANIEPLSCSQAECCRFYSHHPRLRVSMNMAVIVCLGEQSLTSERPSALRSNAQSP